LLHLNKQHVSTISLVEHTKDLATSVLAASFLMVHDTSRGGQDNITELTGRKQVGGPLLKIGKLDVETGGDDTALVDTTNELNNNLAGTVIVNLLELANVAYYWYSQLPASPQNFLAMRKKNLHTMLLHDRKELDNDLGGRTDKNLTLSTLLSVVDVVQGIVEDRDTDHVC
jgi:hypothetical protein